MEDRLELSGNGEGRKVFGKECKMGVEDGERVKVGGGL